MKRFFILFFIVVSLFAKQESCYTVQLSSNVATQEGLYHLWLAHIPKSCHIFNVQNYFTPRCGCFNRYSKAKLLEKKLQKKYKEATVVTVYKQFYNNQEGYIKLPKELKAPKLCDSIELLREDKTKEQKEMQREVPLECKWLSFNTQRALRCGCYDSQEEQLKALDYYKHNFPMAKVTQTYITRFNGFIKAPKEIESCKDIFKKEHYKKAVECFKKDIQHYSDFQTQILWAQSEQKRGRINYEIAAYERALTLKPTSYSTAKKLLELYLKNHQKTTALSLLDEVQQSSFSQKEKQELEAIFHKELKTAEKKDKLYSIVLNSKIGYDTNIASTSDDGIEVAKLYKDFFLSNTLALSYKKYITKKRDIFIKSSLVVYSNFFATHTLYNTFYTKVALNLNYKYKQSLFSVPLSFAYTNYLKENLLKTYATGLEYKTKFLGNYSLKLASLYSKKRYIPASLISYNSDSYGIDSLMGMNKKQYLIQLKLAYLYAKASRNNSMSIPPKYLDFKSYSILLRSFYKLDKNYSIDLKYNYNISYYKDVIYSSNYSLLSQKRKDRLQKMTLTLNQKLSKSLNIFSEIVLTDNNSNLSVSDYSKQLLSVGMSYKF